MAQTQTWEGTLALLLLIFVQKSAVNLKENVVMIDDDIDHEEFVTVSVGIKFKIYSAFNKGTCIFICRSRV